MTKAAPKPGWYQDPKDGKLARYWNGERWTATTRPANAPVTSGTVPSRPDQPGNREASHRGRVKPLGSKKLLVLVAVAATSILVVLGLIALTRDDGGRPARQHTEGEGRPEKLVYSFVSPQVACCSIQRTEGTSKFKVTGRWRVAWTLDGVGDECKVIGRISDPAEHSLVDLEPFGSGKRGEHEYRRSGTYAVSLTYDCPPKSIAMIQLTVFD